MEFHFCSAGLPILAFFLLLWLHGGGGRKRKAAERRLDTAACRGGEKDDEGAARPAGAPARAIVEARRGWSCPIGCCVGTVGRRLSGEGELLRLLLVAVDAVAEDNVEAGKCWLGMRRRPGNRRRAWGLSSRHSIVEQAPAGGLISGLAGWPNVFSEK
jgi:hypothetical protein